MGDKSFAADAIFLREDVLSAWPKYAWGIERTKVLGLP